MTQALVSASSHIQSRILREAHMLLLLLLLMRLLLLLLILLPVPLISHYYYNKYRYQCDYHCDAFHCHCYYLLGCGDVKASDAKVRAHSYDISRDRDNGTSLHTRELARTMDELSENIRRYGD